MNKQRRGRRLWLLGTTIAVGMVLFGCIYIICWKLDKDKERTLSARVVVSWDDSYHSVDKDQETYFIDMLLDVLQLQTAELEATNGMVLLERHRFTEGTREDFTIEVIFDEALSVWINNEDGERVKKEIYGIFYAPGRFVDVVNFAGSPKLAKDGDYSMEYMGVTAKKQKLMELREEIKKCIHSSME